MLQELVNSVPIQDGSNFTVKNSTDFASTIASEEIQDHEIMVSFDVESLFTNVPIEGAVQAALQKMENDAGLADRTTLTPNRGPLGFRIKIYVLPVQWIDLRTTRRRSHGEPCISGYC